MLAQPPPPAEADATPSAAVPAAGTPPASPAAPPAAPPKPRGKPAQPPALEPIRRLPRRTPPSPSLASVRSGPPYAAASPQAQQALHRRPFINLCGDYRFLRAGYWALVDAELNGVASNPSPMQAVTAQNAAACLLVARHAGIETVDWKVAKTPQDVEPPALLVPLSGLTDVTYEVKSTRSRAAQWRSATQNGTRAALAVKLTGELRSLRMIVGVTSHDNYQLAWDAWRTFGVPLATIWYIEAGDPDGPTGSKPLLLGLDPLPLHEVSERELRLYEEVSQRPLMLAMPEGA